MVQSYRTPVEFSNAQPASFTNVLAKPGGFHHRSGGRSRDHAQPVSRDRTHLAWSGAAETLLPEIHTGRTHSDGPGKFRDQYEDFIGRQDAAVEAGPGEYVRDRYHSTPGK